MNKIKRLCIQLTLWFVIGVIFYLSQENTEEIFIEHIAVFLLQGILISGLIYYMAPQLLFKKKYLVFAFFSLIILLGFSFITEHFGSPQMEGMEAWRITRNPDFRPSPRNFRKPPPKFFLQFLILSVAYILAIITETFIFLKAKEEETTLTEKINLQNELKFLKSQINPHFLFNSLNNIYALSAIDSQKTQESISYLSDMLRYVLYECEQDVVPLKKEVTYIKNYLKLHSLKSSKQYPITTEFNIENRSFTIAPMLFIPFLENAIKHSNIEKITDTFINIKFKANSKHIYFEIENSVPITVVQKDGVGGIGLENVKKRLSILYPEKHQLIILENKNSFKVQLQIMHD